MDDSNKNIVIEEYPYNNVWVDYGVLSSILGIHSNNPNSYNKDLALSNIIKIEKYLESIGVQKPKLIVGFQSLESNSDERRKFIQKLVKENAFVYVPIADKSGYEALHWFYMMMEMQMRFIAFTQGFPPGDKNGWRKIFIATISITDAFHSTPMLPGLNVDSYKTLGPEFKKIVEEYERSYYNNKIPLEEIYSSERKALYHYLNDFCYLHIPRITQFLFEGLTEKEKHERIKNFTESVYFQNILSADVYVNLFAVLLSKRRGYKISTSERQDLIGITEGVLFADIIYTDRRIVHLWKSRPDRNINFDIRKSGDLEKIL